MPHLTPAALLLLTITAVATACPFSLQTGDVTRTTAIIQASLNAPSCRTAPFTALTARAHVQVASDHAFTTLLLNATAVVAGYTGIDPRAFPGAYVAKVFLSDLTPATRYYYRFTSESGAVSPTGALTTLRAADYYGPFNFLHMSCANENPYPVASALKSFADAARPDFALFNGDVVYADRFWIPENLTAFDNVTKCCRDPVPTLGYYRSLYADQRDAAYTGPGFPEVLRSIPIFSTWDDHAVNDNYAGQDGDPRRVEPLIPFLGAELPDSVPKHLMEAQYQLGYQAFFEMNAVTPGADLQKADPVEGLRTPETRLFRKFSVGPSVEVFTLDLRQYRDIPVQEVGFLPILPDGVDAAELCDTTINPITAGLCAALPQSIVNQEGFREANKTFLGMPQKQWLKRSLKASKATFKIVVSSVQILEWYIFPNDRWEGYWQERKEIIDFIEDERVANVVFLVGDVHASMYSRINPGRTPAIHEFTTGPIGGSTFAGQVSAPQAFAIALFIAKYGANAHKVPEGEEKPIKFVNLDVPNFMSVTYSQNKLIIKSIGPDGEVITDKLRNSGLFELEAEVIAETSAEASAEASGEDLDM